MSKSSPERTSIMKNKMLVALAKNKCLVATAAKKAGIERKTHYQWMQEDPEYAEKVKQLNEELIDHVENILHKHIETNPKAGPDLTKFWLKAKARERNYTDKTEIEHSGTMPVSINVIMPKE